MAEMSPARKRALIAFAAIGIALIVQRTIASTGAGADVVAAPERPAPAIAAEPLAAAPAPSRQASAAAAQTLRLDRLGGRAPPPAGAASGAAPLFAVQSWQPPPPPPPPPDPPAEPAAPPFPYSYMGGLSDDSGRTAFFNRGDRVLPVRAGETVDGQFRVDHLDETSMSLTYLPLNKTLQVTLGGPR